MIRLITLLRRIVEEVKEEMSAYYLTTGAIMVPTGFVVYIETHNILLSAIAFLIGMTALLMGVREIKKEKKRELEILKAQFKTQEYLDEKADIRHKELIDEIKKFRGIEDDKPN